MPIRPDFVQIRGLRQRFVGCLTCLKTKTQTDETRYHRNPKMALRPGQAGLAGLAGFTAASTSTGSGTGQLLGGRQGLGPSGRAGPENTNNRMFTIIPVCLQNNTGQRKGGPEGVSTSRRVQIGRNRVDFGRIWARSADFERSSA